MFLTALAVGFSDITTDQTSSIFTSQSSRHPLQNNKAIRIARRRQHHALPCAVARHWVSSFLLGALIASALLYYALLDRHGECSVILFM
jgi:hypothetical protein